MIVYSAFIPHTPLLIEGVGKENTQKFQATLDAIRLVREELYTTHPDTIVLISSHGHIHADAFSANSHVSYEAHLADFGDLTTHTNYRSDIPLIHDIQNEMWKQETPFTLDSFEKMDYGFGVSSLLLMPYKIKPLLVPISHSTLSAKSHVQFGRALKEVLSASHKRIAVIATGDLSHALSSDSPAGFRQEGIEYDEKIILALQNASLSQLLSMDAEMVEAASECSYRPLLILFGVLEKVPIQPEVLSYEHPFGVGELVVDFHVPL